MLWKNLTTPIPPFEQRYPNLASLIGQLNPYWLDDQDSTEEETIVEGADDDEMWRSIAREGRQALAEKNLPRRDIERIRSCEFRDAHEARQWLTHHIHLIEALLKAVRHRDEQE